MRPLAHGAGLARQLEMPRIVIAFPEKHEEWARKQRAQFREAEPGSLQPERKGLADERHRVAAGIRRHRELDAIRPAERREAMDDLRARRVPEEEITLRAASH